MRTNGPAAVLVIGCGRMGAALLECWADHLPCYGYDSHIPPPAGVTRIASPAELRDLPSPLAIVVAVKPGSVISVLEAIGPLVGKESIVVSVAAGVSIAQMRLALPQQLLIARVMPNLASASGDGTSAVFADDQTAGALASALFDHCGTTLRLSEETWMAQATVVSGSGPAYFLLLAEELANAAATSGLAQAEAQMLARGALIAAGSMARKDVNGLATLRQAVTSPGGTTAAALDVFHTDGLPRVVAHALDAGMIRYKELATS